jgi:hypothetical protein
MMSKEYDDYLDEHCGAVSKAARWMLDNLPVADELTDSERKLILLGVLIHDASKHAASEYDAYDAYFYGEKDEDAFNRAWLHHIHHNPHHWQYWILITDDGEGADKIVPLEMPKNRVFEMVADWWSFSWRSGNLGEVLDWYESHKNGILLHPNTRAYVERILGEIKERVS